MSRDSKNNSTSPVYKTIRCHLLASEDILRQVWEKMTQENTPLIIELLKAVSEQPEFEANKEKGTITKTEIKELRKVITEASNSQKQQSRLLLSAESLASEVYTSWLKLYKKRIKQKEGKEYFLKHILKSDAELVEESNSDLQTIRCKAQEILNKQKEFLQQIPNEHTDNKLPKTTIKKTKENNNLKNNEQHENALTTENSDKNIEKSLNDALYEIHRTTQDIMTKCAVAHLIKNCNKLSEAQEDISKLQERRTEKEAEIKRLEKQINNSRLPNGRDITGEKSSQAFDNLINQVPQDNEEFAKSMDIFLKKVSNLPYPIDYLYDDCNWYKNEKKRICVYFRGWSKYRFQICCNKRQLHFFERFLEDHQALKASEKGEDKLSGSLVTLRSVQLLWQQGKGKGVPWKVNKLVLHCTYDARLWTAEGTEEVRQEKTARTQKEVHQVESNENLDSNEQKKLKKKKSSLSRLNNSFVRPSKPIYQGKSNIIVGISFHPVELVTLAIVDVTTKEILSCKTVKELLGDAFFLLSRRRRQQVHFRKERKKAQKKDSPCNLGESKLGEYVDKLLAKRILEVAKEYQAGGMVLPRLEGKREIRTSVMQAKAETKFPGNVNAQKLYVKEDNRQIHYWSYNRLQKSIKSKAAELKISIEFATQPSYDTFQNQARDLVLSAYQSRNTTIDR